MAGPSTSTDVTDLPGGSLSALALVLLLFDAF